MILHHLAQIAETKILPVTVIGAVITVPTTFNHSQRKAVMDAAHIAGIKDSKIINEPTAAAVTY